MDERLPTGVFGPEADQMAQKMLSSINDQAWRNTGAISWGYDDRSYVWDKKRHFVEVNYDGYLVLLDINARNGWIKKKEEGLTKEEESEVCLKAWKYWCNDSFWLNPISKVFDSGTVRSIVKWRNQDALLVTYTTGGSTPGDSYLWILDENGRPKSWKMWVSIIPIGGMEFSWDKWIKLETGVWISTFHLNAIKSIPIKDPIAKSDLSLMYSEDLFRPLLMDQNLISF